MRRRPKKILNNSNKMLTALVCILAVVCLVAGGIYIDTFHGQGRFLALIGKTNRTQAQEEDAVMQEDTPKESVAVDAGSKAAVAAFGKEFLLCTSAAFSISSPVPLWQRLQDLFRFFFCRVFFPRRTTDC